jgi:phosphatidylserine/phosphatidylglycerophosphate/cardiolipin synthase-like enzyme
MSPPVRTKARKGQAAPKRPLDGPDRTAAQDWRILRPGHNCWRVAEARRAAVLVDAADYYRHLHDALCRARHSIVILGWDFDGRIKLCPDREAAQPLGPFLRALVEERPDLEIRILVWSYAVVHAPGDSRALLLGDAWQEHSRIHLHLDTRHPFYASHHQKVVVVDESVAFAGGIDLTIQRWDASSHLAENPCRVAPDGTGYEPVHDLQMAVEGEAALALGELAKARWQVALGETLPTVEPVADGWPDDLKPDFTHVPVAIARTAPGWGAARPVKEVARLTVDAIQAARRSIYMEAQYLSSTLVRDALVERLSRHAGPEIVMIITPFSRGFFEKKVLGVTRDRIMRRLGRLPGAHRLRFYYPVVPPVASGREGERQVLVHAKVMIIDDDLLRVGSGNLSNRSMGLDTECDLAIEATDEGMRRTIAEVRSRLLAEHLGVLPEQVRDMLAAKGSLIAAVEALNGHARGLRRFDPGDGPTRAVLGTAIVDPARPWEPLWFLGRKRLPTRTPGR